MASLLGVSIRLIHLIRLMHLVRLIHPKTVVCVGMNETNLDRLARDAFDFPISISDLQGNALATQSTRTLPRTQFAFGIQISFAAFGRIRPLSPYSVFEGCRVND